MKANRSAPLKTVPAARRRGAAHPAGAGPADAGSENPAAMAPEAAHQSQADAGAEAGTRTGAAPGEPARQPEPAPDAPAIVIEIDPGLSGSHVRNRYDIMVRGRAVSAAALEDVRLEVGDRTVGTVSFGQPGHAAPGALPDGAPARRHGFQFNLPRQNGGERERCSFRIVARTAARFEHGETFTIDVDPAAAQAVSVVAGPTLSAPAGGARPHVLMYIESATVDDGGNLLVQGWATALGPILAVQLFAGEKRIPAAKLGGERGDVAAAYAAYPNARLSGFNLAVQLNDEDRRATTLRAQVICPNGFTQQEAIPIEAVRRRVAPRPAPAPGFPHAAAGAPLAPDGFSLFNQQPAYRLKTGFRINQRPIAAPGPAAYLPGPGPEPGPEPASAPPAAIHMFCDEAELRADGTLFVNGWAVCAAGIAQVRVLLDERDVGLAAYGHDRADVGTIYPDIPMAGVSGFKFERRLVDRADGDHVVRVVVRNARNEEKDDSRPVVLMPAADAAPPAAPDDLAAAAAPTAEQAAEFRLELDAPAVVNGAVVDPVTGRLTIEGWLLSRSGIAGFEVFIDDQRLGDAHCGLARQDVGAAFPEWPNALRSGFAFHCPPRSLRDGSHTVGLKVRSNSGQTLLRQFGITVKKSDDQQDQAGIRRRIARAEADLMAGLLADLNHRPAYRFILRQVGPVRADRLDATLHALRLLAYADWSALVLAPDDAAAAAVRAAMDDAVPHLAHRFTVLAASDAAAWNAPLVDAAAGDTRLHMLLGVGDEPGADALLEFAVAGGMNRDADMLYADEVRTSPVTQEREPFFKPDFSPDLLHATNYIGRPWVATGGLLARTGATPASLLADGEYDLVLRCAELSRRVHHVAKVLCQRSAAGLDDRAQEEAALRRMLARCDVAGDVLPTPVPGTWRVKRAVASPGKVSIIIPTCAAHGYIKTCIETLRARTAYPDYEIVCIDNIPADEPDWKRWLRRNADKVVEMPGAFNWSTFNNRAAEASDGAFLLFLNDDVEIVQDDWLDALVEHGQRPEVGVTGARLLYPDGKVQHAGMFLGNNGIGRHAFRFAARDEPCYFGLALTQRNVIAVTGACLLVRRETFEAVGRFEEAHQIVNNDLDFCLRVHRAGLRTVFTPYATLIHHELASRATMKDVFDLTHFNAAWKTLFAAGDPYFSPLLSRHADDYRPDDEPVQWVTPGFPLFHPDEIKRILVVKLDHIGDFVTALPPIRRLKEIFPHATVTVLAGRASRALASVEAGIDAFIPFDFFHARSQLGERQLETDAFVALRGKLGPHRFDLAVDLRKHLSTRDVLKHTGARFLAGFDYLGQFPFLDVSLDWDGDRTLQRKRSHIIDDLLALVEAIGHATRADRVVMHPRPARMPLADLPDDVRALFAKPVVAVHPGAGNVTKQWPTEHFSALIDLLVERDGVNVLLIGGPDEVEVAAALLDDVLHPGAVASMAGRTSLADLPRLLLNCALYIGNDSGPKHIAAAIGMPTIGVHSGVVDPVEWGPLGPRAIALRRNMACSPCYLARAEDCPRALACLRFLEPGLVHEAAAMLMGPRPQAIGGAEVAASSAVVRGTASAGNGRTTQDGLPAPDGPASQGAAPSGRPKTKVRRRQPSPLPA